MSRRRTKNKHHIRPRCRFPPNTPKRVKDENNIVELDQSWHNAWHHCFGPLTPEEAIQMIRMVMTPNAKWSRKQLVALQDFIIHQEEKDD